MSRILLSLATAAVLLCVAPAAHAAQWATTAPLSPENRIATDAQVVLTPDGERIVAWLDTTFNGQTQDVAVRTANAGAEPGPIQTFPGVLTGMQLAAGSDGTVALSWVDFRNHTIHIARRAPGESRFTEAMPLVPTTTEDFGGGQLVVTNGAAYVATTSFSGFRTTTSSSVWLARLPAGGNAVQLVPGTGAGGSVDHVSFVPPAASVFVQSLSMAAHDGLVTLTWQQDNPAPDNSGNRGTTTVKVARSSEAVTAPAPLATLVGSNTSSPGASPVAAAGGGRAYVLWHSSSRVALADLANPGQILQVPADTDFRSNLQAEADGSGTLVAAWEAAPRDRDTLVAAVVVPPGQAPPPATRLTQVGPERSLADLAVAPDGSALALPQHGSGFNTSFQIDGLLRTGGSAFGPVEDISGPQDVSRLGFSQSEAAVAPGGRAVAVWAAADHSGTLNQRLRLSERDTAAPVLGTIAVPATATVGERAGFAATAGDILSGTTISWDFGDGSQADGGVVDHVFGQPGPAVVTITATDEAGNSASEQRVVAVQPAPGPGPSDEPAADRTRPTVSRVSLTNKRFRVTRRGTAQIAAAKRKKRVPAGTALRLTLSERATLAIAIERRKVVRGTLVRASAGPGAVTIPFSGRVGRTALAPGSYTATITAIDGAGNRSRAVRVKFSVSK